MEIINEIAIVVASDNHYAVMIAALFKSIELNHKSGELICFVVIDGGISKNNKRKIQHSINSNKIRIRWVAPSEIIAKQVKIPQDQTTFPVAAYYRLFAPYAAGIDYEKIIYMDVDMIVYDDIANLYNIDIDNYILGAVIDYSLTVSVGDGGIPNYKELGIAPDTKYFNSGLLLINSKKWIEADIANNVIKCMNDNKEHVIYADQYGLNVVLQNQWFEIERKWNCSPIFGEIPIPSVIHFLDIKPIFKSCFALQKHKDEFYRNLSLTPFKDFKPISDYHRLLKKGFTKAKKIIRNTIFSNG